MKNKYSNSNNVIFNNKKNFDKLSLKIFFIIDTTYLQNIYKYDLRILPKFFNCIQRHFVELNFHWWSQVGSSSASFR